ncbi:MAG: hypothetical protein HC848_06430 [Limnobacter sp.]|nr:hypothetical protein [Limnobacter sp.]
MSISLKPNFSRYSAEMSCFSDEQGLHELSSRCIESLKSLPPDMLREIINHLSLKNAVILGAANKELHGLVLSQKKSTVIAVLREMLCLDNKKAKSRET